MTTRHLASTGAVAIGICSTLAIILIAGAAEAAFRPVEDFEALELGPLDGQNGWRAFSVNSAVVTDPAGGTNQALQVVTESTRLYRELTLPDGTTRMMFLRFRYEDHLNFSMGTCEATVPDQFGDFDVELNMANNDDDLRINDDGSYRNLTVLKPELWYNVWLLIDNAEDVTAVWLHARPGEPALPTDRISTAGQSLFQFRDQLVGDMRTFFIKTGGGSGVLGPLHIDDIYLENSDAKNLDNPASSLTGVTTTVAPPPSLSIYPNPFNPRTTISFDLAQAQHVEVTVHDLAGRVITDLMAGDLTTGKHALIWNGRDRGGHEVPTGSYLVRLRSAVGVQASKITLVR